MVALGLSYLPTGKHSRPGSQLLSVMILTRNWKPPWQACALAKFLPIWLSPICGQASWFLFWLISLQRHGICSYTARSRALYRNGCDWYTTTLSWPSQTPSYFPKAWGHSDGYQPDNRPFLADFCLVRQARYGQSQALILLYEREFRCPKASRAKSKKLRSLGVILRSGA